MNVEEKLGRWIILQENAREIQALEIVSLLSELQGDEAHHAHHAQKPNSPEEQVHLKIVIKDNFDIFLTRLHLLSRDIAGSPVLHHRAPEKWIKAQEHRNEAGTNNLSA